MPTEAGFILSHPPGGVAHFLSNLTSGIGGTPFQFTTAYATLRSEVPQDSNLVGVIDIPAYTNRNPGSGVGAFSAPTMTVVIQAVRGSPTQADSAWFDVASFHTIRPRVPAGSTGAGTPANPIFSNRYIAHFQTVFTNVRFSGQFQGSFADFSRAYMAIHAGTRRSRELD